MKRTSILLTAIAVSLLVLAGCGGGGGGDDTPTGNFTVTGASRLTAPVAGRQAYAPGVPNVSPSSVKLKVYALYLGDKSDCSDIQLVYDNGNDVPYVEFSNNPVLFSSFTSPGTYGCMVIKTSDVVKFTPNAEAAGLIAECSEEEYGHDIFWHDEGSTNPVDEWYDPSTDTLVAAQGDRASHVEQHVYLYFPYYPDYDPNNADQNPATLANAKVNPHQVVPMYSKIEIVDGGATIGEFMVDFTNRVEADQGYCTLDSPVVEFTLSVD